MGPPNELTFSFSSVVDGFEKHIRDSIRGYGDLVADCLALSQYFVEDDTTVLDIGCSTGAFLYEVWSGSRARCPRASYVGIDIEPTFKDYWQKRSGENLTMQVADIRSAQIPARCSFVTSIFSLQFISERERQKIVDQLYNALVPGGALIVAEKTLSRCAKLNEMLSAIHYDFKRQSFSESEIQEKARSLRSVMKPWTEDQIVNSLIAAGFAAANVQSFWRNHAFAALIALR